MPGSQSIGKTPVSYRWHAVISRYVNCATDNAKNKADIALAATSSQERADFVSASGAG